MSECKHKYFQGSCEEYFRCENCADVFESYDLVTSQSESIAKLEADNKELKARVAELEEECENLGYETMGEDL